MARSKTVIRGSEAPSVQMNEKVSRKTLAWGDRTLLSEVTLPKDGVVPIHAHHYEQIGYISSGALEFTIGDEVQVVRQGDGYIIPANVRHGCRALEDTVALDIFSPVRDEYK